MVTWYKANTLLSMVKRYKADTLLTLPADVLPASYPQSVNHRED